jgi:hypothetical protein
MARPFYPIILKLSIKMAGFMHWYIRSLKTRPLATNLVSGVVLMATGDVLAQQIEKQRAQEDHTCRLEQSVGACSAVPQGHHALHTRRLSLSLESHNALFYTNHEETWNRWRESVSVAMESLQTELQELDKFRLMTMIGWSVCYMTPFFVCFYRFMDKIFPQRTVASIGARVFGSFIISIPTNALFFMYGTSVNHVFEWNTLREEWRTELKGFGLDEATVHDIMKPIPPFHVETMVTKGVSKIEADLLDTVSVSAKGWIPINLVNFALFPPHLRPLVFSTASVFWNCYLSLAMYATPNGKDAPKS